MMPGLLLFLFRLFFLIFSSSIRFLIECAKVYKDIFESTLFPWLDFWSRSYKSKVKVNSKKSTYLFKAFLFFVSSLPSVCRKIFYITFIFSISKKVKIFIHKKIWATYHQVCMHALKNKTKGTGIIDWDTPTHANSSITNEDWACKRRKSRLMSW